MDQKTNQYQTTRSSSAKPSAGSSKPSPTAPGQSRGIVANPQNQQQPLANPRWLLGGILIVVVLAAICVYGAICLLFWQGQWQLVFGQSKSVSATPAAAGLKYDDIRFDATETGILQLDGWWIPADSDSRFAADTLLFLRDGSGSLSDSVAQLGALHALGINLFAFDYRGFGSSTKIHPSEKSLSQDADAAWQYLVATRHIAPRTMVVYGAKLGAAVTAGVALRHSETAAVVFENLQPPVLTRLAADPRTRLLPVRLLFHDRFDPTQVLARLTVPKLFLSRTATNYREQREPLFYGLAAEAKTSVIFRVAPGAQVFEDPSYAIALNRFLNQYLPRSSH